MKRKCTECIDGWVFKPDEKGIKRAVRCDCYYEQYKKKKKQLMKIPKRYEECTIDNFEGVSKTQAKAKSVVKQYIKVYPKITTGFLFYGSTGVGKTHLALAIMKELATKGHSCLFYDYRELLNDIKATYQPNAAITETDIFAKIFFVDIFVLDELGSEKTTGWVRDTLMTILNKRYNELKTTIITTNFTDISSDAEDSLGERIGAVLRSRLYEMCRTIELKGKDFRQERRQREILELYRRTR